MSALHYLDSLLSESPIIQSTRLIQQYRVDMNEARASYRQARYDMKLLNQGWVTRNKGYYLNQCKVAKKALRQDTLMLHKLLYLAGITQVKPQEV